MDLEISTSKPRGDRPEYVHSNSDAYGPMLPPAMPPPSILLKKVRRAILRSLPCASG
jgi:hypothetical protein